MKILGDYELKKSEVLDLLNDISKLAREVGYETPRMNELVSSYEESLKTDSINIGVVGEWNNGKSSLINALLGYNLLLSANKECTAAITEITYSEKNYIKIFKTSSEDRGSPFVSKENISAEEMSSIIYNYTTTWGSDVETEVEYVEIGWPYQVLDKKIRIIDTPGVNSHNEMRSSLTYAYLPRCHAILVLIDANKPGTTFDIEFIRQIKNKNLDNIFFLLNKVDSISEKAFKEGAETLNEILQPLVASPNIIGISSLAALYSGLPKQSLIDLKNKGDFTPGLQFLEHKNNTVGFNDPGYSEALFELSNMASLYELLSKYFEKEYGLKQFFKAPLYFMDGIINDISVFLEDQLSAIQSDGMVDKINADIINFEKQISEYDGDKSRLRDEITCDFDAIFREYNASMKNTDGRSAVYINIANKIQASKIDDLTAKKNAKLNIVIQNTIMEYASTVASRVDKRLAEIKEKIDTSINNIAQDIQAHVSTKFNTLNSMSTGRPCTTVDEATTKTNSTSALAATGVFGSAAAAAVLGISTTSIVTGATFFGFSTGFGATLPFLASNPIGWAVGAALVTGGLGYMIFRKKPNADSIVENLRKEQFVEHTLDYLLVETEKSFDTIKSKFYIELTTIVDDLISKARRLLDERKRLRDIEASSIHRKVVEIEGWILSTQSLQERLSATSKVD